MHLKTVDEVMGCSQNESAICDALRQVGRDALAKLDDGVEPNLIIILSNINRPEVDWLDLLGEVADAPCADGYR